MVSYNNVEWINFDRRITKTLGEKFRLVAGQISILIKYFKNRFSKLANSVNLNLIHLLVEKIKI